MFKKGDRVRCLNSNLDMSIRRGSHYTISRVSGSTIYLSGSNRACDPANFERVRGSTMKEERKPHKHAAVIKAWADGAEVQYKIGNSDWFDTPHPNFGKSIPNDAVHWRVKPAPVLKSLWTGFMGKNTSFNHETKEDALKYASFKPSFLIERKFEDEVLVDVVVHKL